MIHEKDGRRVASFALILVAGTLLGLWYWHWQSITPRVRADFEWFSTLGFPDVKGCPYVRVATGRMTQEGGEPPRNCYFEGFLLGTNGNTFKVLTPDLFVRTFTNSGSSTPEHIRVGYEVRNLDKEVKTKIKVLEQTTSGRAVWFAYDYNGRLAGQAENFALAWACWRQGQVDNARRLYEEAKLFPKREIGIGQKQTIREKMERIWLLVQEQFKKRKSKPSMRENLEKELSLAMMWETIENFGDTSISRSQLLTQVETIVKNYPRSDFRKWASQTAEVLQRMIVEDQQHKNAGTEEFAGLGKEEKVSELIFLLRDQGGEQWSPGSPEIFKNTPDSTNSPAYRLVAMGYSAVPQLIAALESKTLTRSVYLGRGFYHNRILNVGDCAVAILQQITGKNFFNSPSSKPSAYDQRMSHVRKAAETWWGEFQKKGKANVDRGSRGRGF